MNNTREMQTILSILYSIVYTILYYTVRIVSSGQLNIRYYISYTCILY